MSSFSGGGARLNRGPVTSGRSERWLEWRLRLRRQLLVGGRVDGVAHAAGDVGPRELRGRSVTDLAGLQGLDVVGRGQSAGSPEGQEVVEALLAQLVALLRWHQL